MLCVALAAHIVTSYFSVVIAKFLNRQILYRAISGHFAKFNGRQNFPVYGSTDFAGCVMIYVLDVFMLIEIQFLEFPLIYFNSSSTILLYGDATEKSDVSATGHKHSKSSPCSSTVVARY